MRYKDVDPKMKRFFPWALFLAAAIMLALAAMAVHAEAEEDIWACYGPARYEAMSSGFTPCTEMSKICVKVREFLASGHTVEEGRAIAVAKNIPEWIVRKAERCIQ
jgi:hypothetical protein